MPTLLSDPPLAFVLALGVLALVAAGLWARYRGRVLLGVAAVLVLLLAAWLLTALLNESPREEAVRRVSDMAEAVTEKNWAKFGDNVSDSFSAKGRTKADLKGLFERGAAYNLRATAWDFALTDPPRITDTEVVIAFEGKAALPTGEPLVRHFEATFVKDPDGKFRMKSYQAFDFIQKSQPEDIP